LELGMPAMKTVKIIATLLIGFFLSVPHAALAQVDEAAALNQQVLQLYSQGRYSEAIPLAQRTLAIVEKARVPTIPMLRQRWTIWRNSTAFKVGIPMPSRFISGHWR
jgi:hypothetical protein